MLWSQSETRIYKRERERERERDRQRERQREGGQKDYDEDATHYTVERKYAGEQVAQSMK